MRRVVRPELLDSGQATDTEVQASLADLRLVNRWFGGIRTTRRLIDIVLSRHPMDRWKLLDVGSASGDGPAFLQRIYPNISCTLLDLKPAHLNGIATRFNCVAGDATKLPFLDNSFDLVTCSLFAHHLQPDEFHSFVKEALRVARVALLINDLRRSPVHLGLIYAGMPLYRSRLTRHDAPTSVWRAYTADEMKQMLQSSPARLVEVHETYLYRIGAIAWK
jgi:ubiquinone/menaquinone biosynthesis C-methylase UbiE